MKEKIIITTPIEVIQNKIYLIRSRKVMFDRDLAGLYGVETKILNRAVSRNRARFPEDFMFKLSKQEIKMWENLRCQFDTSSSKYSISNLNNIKNLRSQIVTSSWGGQRYAPHVFTEQGIAMLSSVLRSEQAIQVNIQIMRTFTKIREMITGNRELREKIEELEKKYDKKFKIVFQAIHQMLKEETKPQRIGF